ncbi:hypothetical protein HYC85_001329 [Camellia sinensis]|uniref:2Fe-2S ferredoxin-type domain-containing protein n=1 Tax=Camellia sinensis TaxID=4442 RepID=A0A7J7I536_CAMSI|nr:hypothetical protein HYC85_001329 [Camellia sinensis]
MGPDLQKQKKHFFLFQLSLPQPTFKETHTETKTEPPMNLRSPCTLSTPLHRLFPSPNSSNSLNFRRRTTSSELQTPVELTGRSGSHSQSVPTHKVTVRDRKRGLVHEFFVPEDQYILHTAESQNISLPFACRHGCCTSCAVRGYALLCVGYPSSDIDVETQDEDEVYWLQFGRYFARGPITHLQTPSNGGVNGAVAVGYGARGTGIATLTEGMTFLGLKEINIIHLRVFLFIYLFVQIIILGSTIAKQRR